MGNQVPLRTVCCVENQDKAEEVALFPVEENCSTWMVSTDEVTEMFKPSGPRVKASVAFQRSSCEKEDKSSETTQDAEHLGNPVDLNATWSQTSGWSVCSERDELGALTRPDARGLAATAPRENMMRDMRPSNGVQDTTKIKEEEVPFPRCPESFEGFFEVGTLATGRHLL